MLGKDVVVVQKVLTNLVVALFYPLLGILYGLAYPRVMDRLIGFHAYARHHRFKVVAPEKAHKGIVKRYVELRFSRVSLTARPATQLVVYTARFVAFCSYYIETAQSLYFLVVKLPFLGSLGKGFLVFGRLGLGAAHLACHELGVTSQLDIGTTASHVGGDGNRALGTSLGYNHSLAGMVFGIEHLVPDSPFGKES